MIYHLSERRSGYTSAPYLEVPGFESRTDYRQLVRMRNELRGNMVDCGWGVGVKVVNNSFMLVGRSV